ncbi:Rev7p Ecym_5378 [Eremothecium cymbalariae DBVPG|uniref:HORMA domain-containing protein n=1 Tax=Eremothecium cymbalariae (strain CBS 270.75 / DBVPG 7215 / KCTC 17166 / NRRL Y-17582) TaxID=931890 RepID=I6NDJ1_ERECY|nr:hypothetical protein Ecym_5378 [Eremothecium cymbalariae DBVPG\
MNKGVEKWLKLYLKCFINIVLYYRNVYPPESFNWSRYQAFNLPRHLPVTRHQGLEQYIEELSNDLLTKLEHIRCFNLNIVTSDDSKSYGIPSGQVWERYVLDFGDWIHHSDEDESKITEGLVFDELRACFNDLLKKLQKLPRVAPRLVTFEAIIEVFDLSLGRDVHNVVTEEERLDLDRSLNWVKYSKDDYARADTTLALDDVPEVQLTAVVGCDVGSMVINQYFERVAPRNLKRTIYENSNQLKE